MSWYAMAGAEDILMAADGGGTRSAVVLVAGEVRVEVTGGPANVTTDPEGAVATIAGLMARAASEAGLSDLSQARAYLALAGVLSEAHGAALAAQFPMARVTVSHDRYAAVAGALGSEDGAVIGIGTGSFLGRQAGGRITLMGGWGLLLGDEASGAFLGRAALSATLRAREGWGAATGFTRALEQELGGEAGIIAFASAATPAQFAALRAQDRGGRAGGRSGLSQHPAARGGLHLGGPCPSGVDLGRTALRHGRAGPGL